MVRRAILPMAALLLAGCSTTATAPEVPAETTVPLSESADVVVDQALGELSRDQQVRQLLMPSVDDVNPATARALVRRVRPGGLILMASGTPQQWKALTKAAQAEARRLGLPPLLIAADQENGTLVQRMEVPVELPGAMTLGAAVQADQIRGLAAASASGEMTGRWLRSAGVNVDFAPVADVNVEPANPVIGVRSPSAFPDTVARAVIGQIGGFDTAGMIATAKHFPGHGDTVADSHLGLAEVRHSAVEIRQIDLPPFKAAVKAGVGAIMVAHVTAPALDDAPATVSRKIVTGVLREQLGFEGLVFSDALNMQAVARRPDLYRDAVRAGIDVLLMPSDPGEAVQQVKSALTGGDLREGQVTDAVRRVLAAKHRLGLLGEDPVYPAAPTAGETRKVARQIASAGATVIGSCRKLVGDGVTVTGTGAAADGVRSALRNAGIGAGPVRVAVQPDDPGAADIWVATGSPYPALTSAVRQRVLVYDDVEAAGWAAGRALAGRIERLGGLPVKGPKACERVR